LSPNGRSRRTRPLRTQQPQDAQGIAVCEARMPREPRSQRRSTGKVALIVRRRRSGRSDAKYPMSGMILKPRSARRDFADCSRRLQETVPPCEGHRQQGISACPRFRIIDFTVQILHCIRGHEKTAIQSIDRSNVRVCYRERPTRDPGARSLWRGWAVSPSECSQPHRDSSTGAGPNKGTSPSPPTMRCPVRISQHRLFRFRALSLFTH